MLSPNQHYLRKFWQVCRQTNVLFQYFNHQKKQTKKLPQPYCFYTSVLLALLFENLSCLKSEILTMHGEKRVYLSLWALDNLQNQAFELCYILLVYNILYS